MEAVVSTEMFVPMLATTCYVISENDVLVVAAMKTSSLYSFHF
jgi:hypothetical protein